MTEDPGHPKLGLALSGGGHRAAFFHIGVLARLAELGLLRPIQVISTVSGGSIVGALYYLHVKNLLEAPVPILLLEATTLNTGHNWRFEAMYMGEPPRQGTADQTLREDVDKNTILARTKWGDLPEACRDFPLGRAVAASACFPGGFPPMQVPGLFDDLVVELVDGGVHDNQGVEGLVDRGCTHWIISDGSGQMRDLARPSTRPPAVLGRVISIYGDAEREQRLLQLLRAGDTVAFMHLQTGLPARERTPGGNVEEQEVSLSSTGFGVLEDVQRALAQMRTDLDAFCEVEAWALMADSYQLAGEIVPKQAELARLGTAGPDREWPFEVVAEQLAQPSERFLKMLHASEQRFLKPARMTWLLLPLILLLLVAGVGAAIWGLWLLLTPHGTALFIVGLATLGALAIYAGSQKLKPAAIGLFDVVLPALMALPLVLIGWLQIAGGRWWLGLGRADRL